MSTTKKPRDRLKNLLTQHTPVINPSAVGADAPASEPRVSLQEWEDVLPPPQELEQAQAAQPVVVPEPEAPVAVTPQPEAVVEPEVVVPAPVAAQPAPVEQRVEPVQPRQVAEPAPVAQVQPAQPQQVQESAPLANNPPAPGPTGSWQAARPSPISGGVQRMSNVSVPLDPERYFNMSIARVHTNMTAKEILTEALDDWLIKKGFVQPPEGQ